MASQIDPTRSRSAAISGGGLTIDLDAGSVFDVVLTTNVTAVTLANPPAPGRAVAWPSSVCRTGGTPRVVTPAANAIDIYALITRDGGATCFGFPGGQDFS